jgi:hypothetical protein
MTRQERRRLTREYTKELDRLIKVSDEVYRKNLDQHLLVTKNQEALEKGTCEDKKLQAYYNLMKNISGRAVWLQREITKINDKDNVRRKEDSTDQSVGKEN